MLRIIAVPGTDAGTQVYSALARRFSEPASPLSWPGGWCAGGVRVIGWNVSPLPLLIKDRSKSANDMIRDGISEAFGWCHHHAIGTAVKTAKRALRVLAALLFAQTLLAQPLVASMADVFSEEARHAGVLKIEAALAGAQARHGVIPTSAAEAIHAHASLEFAPPEEIAEENRRVRHRMVALLNVWKRYLPEEAAQYVHFGATTVDIYDTLLVLQLLEASERLEEALLGLEAALLAQAEAHAGTVMMGRTLGQHALPITFGKKLSVWLGENRRNIERLYEVRARLRRSAILKGAVGSYLGLGDQAMAIERDFAELLGLDAPYVADWHGARDVFAEYAQAQALIAYSLGRLGSEIFFLQTTDIGEVVEVRPPSAVGSSTMPHKHNPSKSEALVHYARTIPALAGVVLDDVNNSFERDNTSRPNRVLAEISIESAQAIDTATRLVAELQVNAGRMRANLDRTRGMIMAQRIAFALAPEIGKSTANDRLHEIAKAGIENDQSLREAFLASDLAPLLSEAELDALLDPQTYTGLAEEQTRAVIQEIRARRAE